MFYFYCPDLESDTVVLSPEDSKHCAKTLRMRAGDAVSLTNGCGTVAEAELVVASPSECVLSVISRREVPPRAVRLHLAVAPTKNPDRIEWLVEKSVELGVEQITLLTCEHSERRKVDMGRLHRIAISALKQSQTAVLPKLQVEDFEPFVRAQVPSACAKYIAWCDDENTSQLAAERIEDGVVLLLIGPEGDFSKREIEICKSLDFKEIKLGDRRLRTETAALYGCLLVSVWNSLR